LVVEGGQLTPVATTKDGHIKGFCRRVDTDELAAMMRWCYDNRDEAAQFGRQAASWLRANQTWAHSSDKLIALLQGAGVLERELAWL
jgi:agmatine/peptidylarginine deiminase